MRPAHLFIAIFATAFGCSGAFACGRTPDWALVHAAPPERAPAGAFIAYVSIERADVDRLYGNGLHANVQRVIQVRIATNASSFGPKHGPAAMRHSRMAIGASLSPCL